MNTVSKVEFVGGYTKTGHYPPLVYPEIAFAGRSNVGKSSLINRLLGRRIARTGSTPGRTRQLNFFAIFSDSIFEYLGPTYFVGSLNIFLVTFDFFHN